MSATTARILIARTTFQWQRTIASELGLGLRGFAAHTSQVPIVASIPMFWGKGLCYGHMGEVYEGQGFGRIQAEDLRDK